jgi:hypothetical protein
VKVAEQEYDLFTQEELLSKSCLCSVVKLDLLARGEFAFERLNYLTAQPPILVAFDTIHDLGFLNSHMGNDYN